MLKVQNNRQGEIKIVNDNGESTTLLRGLNEEVPNWVGRSKYAEALHKAGDILVVGTVDDEELPSAEYELDKDGNPVQATDDKGEPIFDEQTGDPVYVPKASE